MLRPDHSGADRIGAAARIEPGDPRYAHLVGRGFNKRFAGKPDHVRLVASTDQVVEAVGLAVRENRRLAVRSGGHCLEGFVDDPAVRVLIDTSAMAGVYHDPQLDALCIEAGTTLGEAYRRLYRGWGVVLPAGQAPDVGIGGHVLGGAFGFLHRQHGMAVDHLHAVEVVVVGADGTPRAVVATRDPADPHHDLFWAHTGCGGGNLGVVTRYWFRSPGASRRGDGRDLLPRAPESVLVYRASWKWQDLDETRFVRLARNYGTWTEENSAAGTPACALFSLMFLNPRAAGTVELKGLVIAGAGSQRLAEGQIAALAEGMGAPAARTIETLSWLGFALRPFPELFVAGIEAAAKPKDALLRRRFTDAQIAIAHRYLTGPEHEGVGGGLGLATYGGQVNTVAPATTAYPARAAILDTACMTGWMDPSAEARSLAWVRALYRDLFADTGGVPLPGPAYDGALINHPDVDLADPAWNTSGVPWSTIYYQGNYPRLQQVKRRYDPGNVFHHALSIRAD
jgi:aclacinomycin oxidase